MKQQLIDKWLKPAVQSPKTSISALGAILVLALPHHSATIAAAVAALGLIFAGDAGKSTKE